MLKRKDRDGAHSALPYIRSDEDRLNVFFSYFTL